MTRNKYLTFLFFEYNDPISAKSTAQILSLNLTYTVLLLNLLINGLCNSSANFSFPLILDTLFYQKPFHSYDYLNIHDSYDF